MGGLGGEAPQLDARRTSWMHQPSMNHASTIHESKSDRKSIENLIFFYLSKTWRKSIENIFPSPPTIFQSFLNFRKDPLISHFPSPVLVLLFFLEHPWGHWIQKYAPCWLLGGSPVDCRCGLRLLFIPLAPVKLCSAAREWTRAQPPIHFT